MNVTMMGTGYVGLVSGACFAEYGVHVTCIDRNGERIDQLRRGRLPIYEPGLEALVLRNVAQNRLVFATELAEAAARADVVFIAVGTPSRRGDGHADLSYVFQAARELAGCLRGYTVVVDKSTVPVGTARSVQRIIREANPGADFDVASNPEFLREGSAIQDFMRPDRVVIGVESDRARETMRELYRPLFLLETPMVITGLESAELIKYASNAFLATKISFINEMANLCEATGASVRDVARGMGLDRRIGPKFLHAGPGFGGSCFPKDLTALITMFQDHGLAARIAEAVVQVNAHQRSLAVKKIRQALGGTEHGRTVAVLGLAFKPETDDLREAPALAIIASLSDGGARIRAYDPQAMEAAREMLPEVCYCTDAYEACQGADAAVIVTEWNEFRSLDLDRLRECLRAPNFIDLRDIYPPETVRSAGFQYYGIGTR
jgi:UDPglucose 6-dehydrogenase